MGCAELRKNKDKQATKAQDELEFAKHHPHKKIRKTNNNIDEEWSRHRLLPG